MRIAHLAAVFLLATVNCITAANAATHIVAINGVTSITAAAGTMVSGIQAKTVDDAGNPVVGHGVRAVGCGTFREYGPSTSVTSDANGIVSLPPFRLRFSGDAATFDYTLDGKTGSIPLSRIPF